MSQVQVPGVPMTRVGIIGFGGHAKDPDICITVLCPESAFACQ